MVLCKIVRIHCYTRQCCLIDPPASTHPSHNAFSLAPTPFSTVPQVLPSLFAAGNPLNGRRKGVHKPPSSVSSALILFKMPDPPATGGMGMPLPHVRWSRFALASCSIPLLTNRCFPTSGLTRFIITRPQSPPKTLTFGSSWMPLALSSTLLQRSTAQSMIGSDSSMIVGLISLS